MERVIVAEDETTVLPDLTPTRRIDLAWSAEEFRPYCLDYYPPAESAPRTRVEVATAIWTLLAIAIMYGCTSDTSYPRVMPASASVPVAAAPSVATVEPTEATESVPQNVWTLPPVPAAEHLREPRPIDELPTGQAYDADVFYLNSLRRLGLVVVNPYDAIKSGHWACSYMRQGHTSWEAATIAMSDNPSLSPIDAKSYVLAASAAYCPDMTR